ncbi:hypothetical protein EV361DRAFT_873411 [Lentinula raphanica]|uniref:Uncharacterized protein n=1 Tax=Lentinula raphanica TaxID=153919 RepID=A0AA38U5C1_9AGAR|nr:hypothetical protein F5878DRAFT_647255 [Lentinula raphanica]KAJ3965169.1 hypothetical protein EV361DRAFT_873411 [Lentinula raphanica]
MYFRQEVLEGLLRPPRSTMDQGKFVFVSSHVSEVQISRTRIILDYLRVVFVYVMCSVEEVCGNSVLGSAMLHPILTKHLLDALQDVNSREPYHQVEKTNSNPESNRVNTIERETSFDRDIVIRIPTPQEDESFCLAMSLAFRNMCPSSVNEGWIGCPLEVYLPKTRRELSVNARSKPISGSPAQASIAFRTQSTVSPMTHLQDRRILATCLVDTKFPLPAMVLNCQVGWRTVPLLIDSKSEHHPSFVTVRSIHFSLSSQNTFALSKTPVHFQARTSLRFARASVVASLISGLHRGIITVVCGNPIHEAYELNPRISQKQPAKPKSTAHPTLRVSNLTLLAAQADERPGAGSRRCLILQVWKGRPGSYGFREVGMVYCFVSVMRRKNNGNKGEDNDENEDADGAEVNAIESLGSTCQILVLSTTGSSQMKKIAVLKIWK